MFELLFFSCANEPYWSFAPLYAGAALLHVEGSAVEVCVDDVEGFCSTHAAARAVIDQHFPNRFLIRPGRFDGVLPHTVRFVETPRIVARYTYIGDIDIMCLATDMLDNYKAALLAAGMPYLNRLRKNQKRLTGLHFTETAMHYPLPDLSDLDLARMNDEMVLYEIVRRKGLPEPKDVPSRPVRGLHMSPGRPAISSGERDKKGTLLPDWNLAGSRDAYLRFRSTPFAAELFPHISGIARASLDTIDRAYDSGFGLELPAR